MFDICEKKTVLVLLFMITASALTVSSKTSADDAAVYAFPDKWMFRLGAYVVDGADTQISVNSDVGLGTSIDYERDLGGEDGETIPRIDAYYRFNYRHRIDFTAFSVSRKGERTLALDLNIGDENFTASETISSEINYTLYKLGYNYSFYHSPKVELSISAGLNLTDYELKFSDSTGAKFETADVSVPLPTFGLRMGYAITPKWSVRYVSEAFFIEIDDALKGALLNYELSTEYKLFKHFALGVGLARQALDVDVNDDNWRGSISDGYRGYNVFGTLYF
ncbi:MAG: DUF481 domain-containing protein [Gammaproteobacteria bacterium]|nr:DUF481 domain-containing protein [Gammaproteobacteria bacterium]